MKRFIVRWNIGIWKWEIIDNTGKLVVASVPAVNGIDLNKTRKKELVKRCKELNDTHEEDLSYLKEVNSYVISS
jgi:hypothetical protein